MTELFRETPSGIAVPVTAIDPSLTGTAICSGTGVKEAKIERFPTKSYGDDCVARAERIEFIVGEVRHHVAQFGPRLILVDGYSMGSQNNREYLGELCGVLFWNLKDFTKNVFQVAPTTFKKFICGSGDAKKIKKQHVMAHIQKQWDRMFATDDEADSFGLYQMALAAVGTVPIKAKYQREAIDKVLGSRRAQVEALGAVAPAF